jgi:hypothetical protein
MKSVTINQDNYSLPTNWNELTEEQLLIISRVSLRQDTVLGVRTKVLLTLLGLKVIRKMEKEIDGEKCFYIGHGSKKLYLMRECDITGLVNHVKFIFEKKEDDEGKVTYQFRSKLFKQLIPVLEMSIIKDYDLYGPGDGLNNILFGEFVMLETYYAEFLKSNHSDIPTYGTGQATSTKSHSEDSMNKLIATMYRPERKGYDAANIDHSDRREPMNEVTIKDRAKLVAKLKPEVKQAILFFYEGCKSFLRGKFPHVFEEEERIATKAPRHQNTPNTFEMYVKLVTSLAKNDATRVNDWMNTELYGVLMAMENMRLEQIELEKLYKKLLVDGI